MKELQDIVCAYDQAVREGKKTALATVVHVQGSSYRREGARMLVTDEGQLTGAISGGCLEGDALRKARLAIAENRAILITYDTTDDDDAKLGVGLGCNGIIQILFEPIDPTNDQNPIQLFKAFLSKRQKSVLTTLFNLDNKQGEQPGTCILLSDNAEVKGGYKNSHLQEELILSAKEALKEGRSAIVSSSVEAGIKCFVELIKPAVTLLIFGAGNDAIPLVQIAGILGWESTVVDGRSNYATSSRFPLAKQVIVTNAESALKDLCFDEQTVAVLMTHNYNYDLAIFRQLINHDIKYLGALGPKKKLNRMIEELREDGIAINESHMLKVFGPTGLEIGAETPEEIALSIVSEVKAVLADATGVSLRKCRLIHANRIAEKEDVTSDRNNDERFSSCSL